MREAASFSANGAEPRGNNGHHRLFHLLLHPDENQMMRPDYPQANNLLAKLDGDRLKAQSEERPTEVLDALILGVRWAMGSASTYSVALLLEDIEAEHSLRIEADKAHKEAS
jgi:hypothetical protein